MLRTPLDTLFVAFFLTKSSKILIIYDIINMNGDDIMNENITLKQALESIEKYAINSHHPSEPSASYREDPSAIAYFSQFNPTPLPSSVITKVPEEFLNIYGKEKGTKEWRKFAKLYYDLVLKKDTRVLIVELMRSLLVLWDEERKYMYKGKDEKDYASFEAVRSADEFYTQHENPTLENGRSR